MENPEPETLCQYGKNKENRPLSIVQMGLFVDREGIPISMCIDPGNTNCLAVNAGQRNFCGKIQKIGATWGFWGIRQTLGKCFLWGNARGDGLPAETSKKGLTENCVTRIIRLRKLYYSHSTVCDEVLQYLFM